MRHPNYYKQIIQGLEKKAHPKYNMGRHLSTALDGSEMWGITDKDLLFALQKYEIELNMDVDHGMNLERLFLDEEED